MEEGHLKMSVKEIDRIPIMVKVVKGEITIQQAADSLELCTRQVKRIKKRFKEEGVKGLVHQSRGRISNRAIPASEIERIIAIVKEEYSDFGPTLALEKLKENHGVTIGREKLRLAMIDQGLWKVRKRRYIVVRQQRRRREREGELVQLDGSPYAWFEGRGPYCTLLVSIDDATGKLKSLRFAKSETTNEYFKLVNTYISSFGKPKAWYTDKYGVFRINSKKGGSAGTTDNNGLTQFGRAMRELSINMVFANSPQAKGRVEKVNRTLQDRLVKEMRLKRITSIKQGNKFLPEFVRQYNRKFAVEPINPRNAHRPLLPSENLQQILIKKEVRVLSKNLEFQYRNTTYQVETQRPTYSMRHAPVVVSESRSGNISVYYKDKKLDVQQAGKQPPQPIANSKTLNQQVDKVARKPWKPAKNHPWRHFVI